MLYCPLDEASNKSFKNKIEQYDTMNKFENFDNYTDIKINYPSYFSAQGDYTTKDAGTTINQLKNNYNDDNEINNNQSLIDSLSFDNDTNFSDDITIASKFKKRPLDHDYCVNVITKELLNNGDGSLMSSHNGQIYKHVKSCAICKSKVKQIMKEQYCNKDDNIVRNNDIEHFNMDVTNKENSIVGYDVKELVLIILGGIILIFIFDLLVRMGEKLR